MGAFAEEIDLKVKKLADQESVRIRLNEMLSNLRRSNMGIKSEKTDLKDYYENGLFNEAELGLHDEATVYEDHAEEIEIKGHTRRSRGRKKLPENLERKEEIHSKNNPDIILAGCMAHARRKFEEVFKNSKDEVSEKNSIGSGNYISLRRRFASNTNLFSTMNMSRLHSLICLYLAS